MIYPNRIRELREERGWSVDELAQRVGTSQPQMTRLETGQRQLTEDWMRRIAKALNVRPVDLLALATAAEFTEEVSPYRGPALLEPPLVRLNLAYFVISSDSVVLAGIEPGKVVLIDMSPAAVKNITTGDIVIAQVYDRDVLTKAITIVRQFVAPSLLVTNRPGANLAIDMDSATFDIGIKGVVVREASRR